ncbi:hypothetical protein TNCV_114791 [Trichonephila clavipes]|nr:hypothetical protein TNCV_114791 [Trichonephila clavipes]
MSLAFRAPKVAGSTPAQVGEFSRCRKSKAVMSDDYIVCKRSLECLFGLGALRKIKILVQVHSIRAIGASLWREIWATKLLAVIGITYIRGGYYVNRDRPVDHTRQFGVTV